VSTVPAIALTVLRDHHADEIRQLKALLHGGEGQADEISRLTEQVKHLKARVANAEAALATANGRANAAQREADAVRRRIADDVRDQARQVSRTWAGAYRHIANQIAPPTEETP
jgi:peptidoglycan hydrolase CwlO-like protein